MMRNMKKIISAFAATFLLSSLSWAQSRFTYDLSGSSGTRDSVSYSEIHLGLNYYASDWFNWRNSLFTQFGTNIKEVYGLDSTALFKYELYNSSKTLGFEVYAGPGLRFATEKSNAMFGTAGITLGLGGLRIGGGVQSLQYFEERKDKDGFVLSKNETQTFITLSGGGSF